MAGIVLSDREAMLRAIELARQGRGFVSPNPPVGCVILDEKGCLLAEGYHQKLGGPHAEIEALNQIKSEEVLKGASLFVTLEPCAHQGRTPPCARALTKLPLKRVVYGLRDPNPQVSGRGLEILREGGVAVECFSELEEELEELADVFLFNQRHQSTFLCVKVASSLDGKVALRSGESQWITGEKSRQRVQELRGFYDAVMVGAGTVLKDNPRLNSRDPRFEFRSNKIIILDLEGKCLSFLPESEILKCREPSEVIIASGASHAERIHALGAKFVPIPKEGLRDLEGWLEFKKTLYSQGIASALVEGGAEIFSSLLSLPSVWNRWILFLAPKIIGGVTGVGWSDRIETKSLQEVLNFPAGHVEFLDPDLLVEWRSIVQFRNSIR